MGSRPAFLQAVIVLAGIALSVEVVGAALETEADHAVVVGLAL